MSSRTLRRRLHHGDAAGGRHDRYETSKLDALNEPLLADRDYDDYNRHNEGQSLVDILDEQRRQEDLHWTLLFSNVIAQWAQWLISKYCAWFWISASMDCTVYSGTHNGATV